MVTNRTFLSFAMTRCGFAEPTHCHPWAKSYLQAPRSVTTGFSPEWQDFPPEAAGGSCSSTSVWEERGVLPEHSPRLPHRPGS